MALLQIDLNPHSGISCSISVGQSTTEKRRSITMKKAYFACGCSWGAQYYFDKCKGVKSTVVGYMGEFLDSPTYEQVKKAPPGTSRQPM